MLKLSLPSLSLSLIFFDLTSILSGKFPKYSGKMRLPWASTPASSAAVASRYRSSVKRQLFTIFPVSAISVDYSYISSSQLILWAFFFLLAAFLSYFLGALSRLAPNICCLLFAPSLTLKESFLIVLFNDSYGESSGPRWTSPIESLDISKLDSSFRPIVAPKFLLLWLIGISAGGTYYWIVSS